MCVRQNYSSTNLRHSPGTMLRQRFVTTFMHTAAIKD
jgi:hypothetical protein